MLRGLLAHEVAHLVHRDSEATMRQMVLGRACALAVSLAILTALPHTWLVCTAIALTAPVMARAVGLLRLRASRRAEYAADRFGADLEPAGTLALLMAINQAFPATDQATSIQDSHPRCDDRMVQVIRHLDPTGQGLSFEMASSPVA